MAVIGEMVYNTDMTIEETIAEIKRKALRDKVPIMEDEGLDFLCDFLKEHRIKSLLEVGTAVGYSSIMMAHHNPQLKILTLEQDEERYHEAVENIERCGLSDRINPVLTNAREFETDEKGIMVTTKVKGKLILNDILCAKQVIDGKLNNGKDKRK